MTTRLRFAPSPTGKLHIGNIRTALLNWLFAAGQGGEMLLRIDDTDLARSTKENEAAIEEDLTWLGLPWALRANQSARFERYEEAAAQLKAKGLLYPCYETEEDLERQRRIAQSRGRPPVYNRAALALSADEKQALEAQGRAPHWRFKLSGARSDWVDLCRGPQSIDTASLSDPVLICADGAFLYTLPSVVDDIDFAITHILRGEDHVTNTGVQIEILHALGASAPAFGHFPLIVGADGAALSKRIGSLSMGELREQGIEPVTVLSLLSKIGTSDPVEARSSFADLVGDFSIQKIGRAPARFDPEDLKRLNAQVLHAMSYAEAKPRLAALGADFGEQFWLSVRANLTLFNDVADWVRVIAGPIAPVIADQGFATAAAEALPAGPYNDETWKAFVDAVKAKTGAKGKALFMPLRQALTGMDHGPDMGPLFALIGPDKARARLEGKAA